MELGSSLIKTLFDKAPVGIAHLDLDRTVRYCNPEFARIYGWDDDGIIGTVLPIPEHQKDNYEGLVRDLRRGLPFVGIETVRVRRDGSEFYARISGAPLTDTTGEVHGFVASIAVAEENYSEQLQQRNLEFLIQSSIEFMCVTDLSLNILFINDAGKSMLGILPDDELDGRTLSELVATESNPRLMEIVHSLGDSNIGATTSMKLKHQKTGASIDVSLSIYLVNDPHTGEPISIGCVAKNLVPCKEVERRAERADAAFETLFARLRTGLVMMDSAARPVDANQAICDLLGYTAEEMKKMPFRDHFHPEEAENERLRFRQLLSGDVAVYEAATRLVRKDGRIVPVMSTAFLIPDRDGGTKRAICVIEPDRRKRTLRDWNILSDPSPIFMLLTTLWQ